MCVTGAPACGVGEWVAVSNAILQRTHFRTLALGVSALKVSRIACAFFRACVVCPKSLPWWVIAPFVGAATRGLWHTLVNTEHETLVALAALYTGQFAGGCGIFLSTRRCTGCATCFKVAVCRTIYGCEQQQLKKDRRTKTSKNDRKHLSLCNVNNIL